MTLTYSAALFNNLPNTRVANDEYIFWYHYWQTIRDCLMGEIMVKARKTRYLARLAKQTDEEYEAFLRRATFYNATARTLNGLVGAIHTHEPLIDGVPTDMQLGSVTNDGQSFEMFIKRLTKEVVAMGRYGVMIDAPPKGGDPYFVGYECEDIVDWGVTRVGSENKLNYVTLREYTDNRTPFDNSSRGIKETYRVLFIDEDGIYKQRVYAAEDLLGPNYTEIVPLMQGRPMTEIPFLFVSPYDFGTDVEKPPLLDIVFLNLSHYDSYAQLERARFLTANPVYTVFLQGGGEEGEEYSVGPASIWQLGGDDRAEIMEYKGSGLMYLEHALTTKEQQIASLGGRLSTQPTGVAAESSDAVLSRAKGEASFLGSVIATINEAGSRLLSSLATWRGTPAQINVTYSSEATKFTLDAREIRAMSQLYETGLLPLETIYGIFRRNNIIPRLMEFEEFKSLLPQFAPKVQNKLDEAEFKAEVEVEKRRELAGKRHPDEVVPPSPTSTPPRTPQQSRR